MIWIYWISFKHFCFCAEVIIFLSAQSLGSPGEYFMIDCSLIVRYFPGFALTVLEYRSAVWCSAADTYHKLLDRVVSCAYFLTGGVFECNIAHRRSVAVSLLNDHPYLMVWSWRVLRAGRCFCICLSSSFSFFVFYCFPVSSFCLYMGSLLSVYHRPL